jgi:Leucine-rich repeat (LRR) protein
VCPNIRELVLSKYINQDEFLKDIPTTNITMLSTYNWFPDLFCQFSHLTHLDLRKSHEIKTLDGIEALNHLVYLDIGQTKVKAIDPLQYLQNLKYLNIANTLVTKIFLLKYCLELEFLCVIERDITNTVCKSVHIIPPLLWIATIKNLEIIPITSIFPIYDSYDS